MTNEKFSRSDILSLSRKFILLADQQLGTGVKKLSKEAEEFLSHQEWKDGEGGLELAVKRACILSEDEMLRSTDFDLKSRQYRSIGRFVDARLKGFMQTILKFEKFNLYDMVIPEVEKSLIVMVLKETNGNQIRAASLLGINRNTLRAKIKKLDINIEK
ncbi:hypothetical protein H8E50_02510 [bacterium]|nr:hypothetical protein [bacterium]